MNDYDKEMVDITLFAIKTEPIKNYKELVEWAKYCGQPHLRSVRKYKMFYEAIFRAMAGLPVTDEVDPESLVE